VARKKKKKKSQNGKVEGRKVIASNRRAYRDYFIDEEIEAGIVLTGTEIKSIREGGLNISDAYATFSNGEMWLIGMHISPYGQASEYFNHDPIRPRKLLVHKLQAEVLAFEIEAKGKTHVPLRVVLKKGWAKVDLGLARGKNLYDKRQTIAERDARRSMERELRRQT
jgi:SsrA-binding protein